MQCCFYKVIKINDNSILTSNMDHYPRLGSACFSFTQHYFANKDVYTEIYIPREHVKYTNEEIDKYFELITQIPIFKLTYTITNKDIIFRIDNKDYNKLSLFKAIMMIIRYLWGDYLGDWSSKIPKMFMILCEKYPDNDILYNLLSTHLASDSYNSNHFLCYTNSYPLKLEDLKINNTSTNDTFTKRSNLTEKELKQLEEIKSEISLIYKNL